MDEPEKIRVMEQEWDAYREAFLARVASEETMAQMHDAFFAGGVVVLHHLRDLTPESPAAFSLIVAELDLFLHQKSRESLEEMIARHTEHSNLQ